MSLKNFITFSLVGALATVGAAFTAAEAIAQTAEDVDPLEGLGTDDDGDSLFGDSANPFDIIHRAVLAPSMSTDEFNQRQQQELGSEADAFRLRQQEAIRLQQSPAVDEATTEIEEDAL